MPLYGNDTNTAGILIRNDPSITDYVPIFQQAIDIVAAKGGGSVQLDYGRYPIGNPSIPVAQRSIIMKADTKLVGTGAGSELFVNNGVDTHAIGKDQTPNVCQRVQLQDFLITGNRGGQTQNNTSSPAHGIYFFQKNSGVAGNLDHYHSIQNVIIEDCQGHGILMDGAGSGVDFFNIREVKIQKVVVRRCIRSGMHFRLMSDSKIDNCTIASCRRAGLYLLGTGNLNFTNCKAFYNCVFDNGSGDILLEGANRTTFLGCEAQESYGHGFLLRNATRDVILQGCRLDANGTAPLEFGGSRNGGNTLPRRSGLFATNSSQIKMTGCCTTDFHGAAAPGGDLRYSWQRCGVTLDNCFDVEVDFQSFYQFDRNYELLNMPNLEQRNIRVAVNGVQQSLMLLPAPASPTSPGRQGETRVVGGFVYYCVADNSWLRSTLSTWT
jgi:Right handed beta helix region